MKLTSLTFACIFLIQIIYAQSFRYGEQQEDERNRAIVEIPGGTLLMAGFSSTPNQNTDLIISRKLVNSQPEIMGMAGTPDPDFAYDLCYYNGFIYMVGESQSLNETDALFTQWDTLGNLIHIQRIGVADGNGQMFKSIAPDGLGHFWISGYHSDTLGGNGNDFWLVKTDTAGNILHQTIFGSRENDYAQSVLTASDAGCWVSGDSKENGNYDVHLYRFSPQGNLLWYQSYGDAFDDGAQGLCLLQNGDLLITGESVPALNAPFDFLFIRVDSVQGNPIWVRRAGGSQGDAAFEAIPGLGTDILFCGYSNSYATGPIQVVFGKLDSYGNLNYIENHGGTGINIGYDILSMQNGQVAIVGFVTDTLSDCFLMLLQPPTGTSVTSEATPSALQVYPNPASPGESIHLISAEPIQQAQLIALDGKVMISICEPMISAIQLPPTLHSAIYLLSVTGKSGKIYSSMIYVHKHLE